MRKIRLDVQGLWVESFDTANRATAEKGTVRGYDSTDQWGGPCNSRQCGSGESCTLEWAACNCPIPSPEGA